MKAHLHSSLIVRFVPILGLLLPVSGGMAQDSSTSATLMPLEQVAFGSPSPYPCGAPGGKVVWEQVIGKEGAANVRIHFSRLDLGANDYLEVLDYRGIAVLKITEAFNGPRWLPKLPGQRVTLRLIADEAGEGAGIEVDLVGFGSQSSEADASRAICTGGAGPDGLLDNITCYKAPEACANMIKYTQGTGVVRLTLVFENLRTQGEQRFVDDCTGFLIDELDAFGTERHLRCESRGPLRCGLQYQRHPGRVRLGFRCQQ